MRRRKGKQKSSSIKEIKSKSLRAGDALNSSMYAMIDLPHLYICELDVASWPCHIHIL